MPNIDESLSFKEHIDEMSNQLNKLTNSYKISRYCVERDNKYNIYFAYTYSKILYGIEVYAHVYINNLQVQQNRSLKIVFQKHNRTHTHNLYKELNLLKDTKHEKCRLQILYINTNKACYLQFLVSILHMEMKFIIISFIPH